MSPARFEVEEVFHGDDDGLLWLTLGYASPRDPLDVLHIACGQPTGAAEQDALYLEGNDQSLAASGQVLALVAQAGRVELHLTPTGAAALGLAERVVFAFDRQPALFRPAALQLARMADCGQTCIRVAADGWPEAEAHRV